MLQSRHRLSSSLPNALNTGFTFNVHVLTVFVASELIVQCVDFVIQDNPNSIKWVTNAIGIVRWDGAMTTTLKF